MSDNDLIKAVAELWVDGGGDAEGLIWVVSRLKQAIQDEIDYREEKEQS